MIARWRRLPSGAQDAVVAAVFALAWFGAYRYWTAHGWRPTRADTYELAGAWTAGALLLRRQARMVVVFGTAAAYPILYDHPLVTEFHLLPVLVAAYAATASDRAETALGAVACLTSVVVLSTATGPMAAIEVDRVLLNAFATACVVGLGVLVHDQQRVARSLATRNEELERLRRLEADRAIADERARIARELHDVVAHHLTAIVVRSQAALRVAPDDPEVAAETLSWVVGTSREALNATRQTVKVLRGDDASLLQPLPGLADLDDVVGRVREAGLDVELAVADDLPAVEPQVDLALLRIGQEALTNVLRHARAGQARLEVRVAGDRIVLVVDDDGRGSAPKGRVRGHGLVGMRERAASCGGRLDLGRSPLGGWRVRAVVPAQTPEDAPAEPGPSLVDRSPRVAR